MTENLSTTVCVQTSLGSKCTSIDCVTDCNGLMMTITLTLETGMLSMCCPICYAMRPIHSELSRNKGRNSTNMSTYRDKNGVSNACVMEGHSYFSSAYKWVMQ